jgi:Fe-S-cluster containining protein
MERIQPAEVACGGCTLCCRSGELILITQDDPDYAYDTREIVVGERTFAALQLKPDGSCIYVTDAGCSIHEHAPITCRVFDCAGLYASKTRRQRRALQRDPYVRALYARGRELHRLRIGLFTEPGGTQ